MEWLAALRNRLRTILSMDRGSAMVITILVMVVLTGMGTLVFVVGSNNLQNAGRDRLAAGAFGASEGGVAQAVAFIRSSGVATLTCDDPAVAGTDCTKLWGRDNPQIVNLSGNRQFSVWVQRIEKFAPPAVKIGTYRIHSTGTAGVGPGKRLIDLTVNVTPIVFPIGVYADTIVDAGTPILRKESMFSQNCITGRDKINFTGIDQYWQIPAAAHSTQYTTVKVNGACSDNNKDNIHYPPPTGPGVCSAPYPDDQDRQGGDLAGTSCFDPSYPTTSFFDLEGLKSYGFSEPRGLSDTEYAALKSKAQEQGTYFETTSYPNPADPPPYLNAVYYFNLKPGGGTVTVQNDLNIFGSASCGERTIIIIIEGGDMHVSAGADIVGAIFVPDGSYRGNGDAKTTGTLFARTIDKLNGTADFQLESCFFNNFPPGLLDVVTSRFREVDR